MGRSAKDWEDRLEDHPAKTTFQIVFLAVGGLLVIGLIATGVLWSTGVIFSGVKGKGDAVVQNNSAQNWTTAQRTFHSEYNLVEADKAKIATAKTNLDQWKAANPAPTNDPIAYQQWSQQESNYQTSLIGPQQECLNTVADYNTNAKSYLTQDWRDASLPESLPTSDCS